MRPQRPRSYALRHWRKRLAIFPILHCSGAAVHRPLMAGISGSKYEGAYSIVFSAGYKSNEDEGDVIIYTGAGGRQQWSDKDPTKRLRFGPQIHDQTWDDWGNNSLVVSRITGRPVRVVRGWMACTKYSPAEGYRYDGLYTVVSHWMEKNEDNLDICRYRLERLPAQAPIPLRPTPPPTPQNRRGRPRGATTQQHATSVHGTMNVNAGNHYPDIGSVVRGQTGDLPNPNTGPVAVVGASDPNTGHHFTSQEESLSQKKVKTWAVYPMSQGRFVQVGVLTLQYTSPEPSFSRASSPTIVADSIYPVLQLDGSSDSTQISSEDSSPVERVPSPSLMELLATKSSLVKLIYGSDRSEHEQNEEAESNGDDEVMRVEVADDDGGDGNDRNDGNDVDNYNDGNDGDDSGHVSDANDGENDEGRIHANGIHGDDSNSDDGSDANDDNSYNNENGGGDKDKNRDAKVNETHENQGFIVDPTLGRISGYSNMEYATASAPGSILLSSRSASRSSSPLLAIESELFSSCESTPSVLMVSDEEHESVQGQGEQMNVYDTDNLWDSSLTYLKSTYDLLSSPSTSSVEEVDLAEEHEVEDGPNVQSTDECGSPLQDPEPTSYACYNPLYRGSTLLDLPGID
ncbi:hypothetical protein V8B97DRAFT_1524280 [Scleroderma yunnanense]